MNEDIGIIRFLQSDEIDAPLTSSLRSGIRQLLNQALLAALLTARRA